MTLARPARGKERRFAVAHFRDEFRVSRASFSASLFGVPPSGGWETGTRNRLKANSKLYFCRASSKMIGSSGLCGAAIPIAGS